MSISFDSSKLVKVLYKKSVLQYFNFVKKVAILGLTLFNRNTSMFRPLRFWRLADFVMSRGQNHTSVVRIRLSEVTSRQFLFHSSFSHNRGTLLCGRRQHRQSWNL